MLPALATTCGKARRVARRLEERTYFAYTLKGYKTTKDARAFWDGVRFMTGDYKNPTLSGVFPMPPVPK